MSALSIGLLLAGLVVVLVLGGYALHLWRRVWAQQKAYAAAESERQQRLNGDLRILAGSLLDEQLPLIEGAIRIKVLLDNYDIALSSNEHCRVFHVLFDATSGIPTHAAWKQLKNGKSTMGWIRSLVPGDHGNEKLEKLQGEADAAVHRPLARGG